MVEQTDKHKVPKGAENISLKAEEGNAFLLTHMFLV